MKKLIALLLVFYCASIFGGEIRCQKEYKPTLESLQQVPEVQALIDEILEDGDIRVASNRYEPKQFEGYWSPSNRTIYLNPQSKTQQLVTLLFEMHNAKRDQDFSKLDKQVWQGKIKKRDYVRAAEYIEYENVVATEKILKAGRNQGLLSSNCRWDHHDNFEDHFRVQKKVGHSAYHGKNYDLLSS